MKKLTALLFFICISCATFAQVSNTLIAQATTIADLKTKPVEEGAMYLVQGIAMQNGGLFYWSGTATAAEDAPYYNYVTSSISGTGRWIRNTVKNQTLPSGFLETNGQIKTITLNGTTDSNGMCAFNLTYEGTSGGTAIPTMTPFSVQAYPQPGTVATSNDITHGQCQAVSANFKTVTCRYGRGSSTALSVLGISVLGLRDAVVNTPVSVQVKTM